MNIIVYEALPPEAAQIRETVFIKEQGFQNEFDGIDNHAKHLVLYHNEAPIATCRFFTKGTSESYVIRSSRMRNKKARRKIYFSTFTK